MAWTTPRTWVAGEIVTASNLNTHLRDNLSALRDGGVAMASQAAGDFVYASSATAFARLAIGAAYSSARVNSGATGYEFVRVVRGLAQAYATSGNVGTGATTVFTYSMPANTLSANGDRIEMVAWGKCVANSNVKTVTVKLGSEVIWAYNMGQTSGGNSTGWESRLVVVRESASAQRNMVFLSTESVGTIGTGIGTTAADLTTGLNLTITLTATSDNDIDVRGVGVTLIPAAA